MKQANKKTISITAGAEKKKKTGPKSRSKKEKDLRVLLLEDNPVDAELMERELNKDGIAFAARRVDTRSGFIKALKAFQPDLILADYKLPKFDALQALELRNKIVPLTPFIIITGSISEDVAVECMKRGADDYLLKDRLTRLGEAVRHALEKRRLQMEKAVAEESLRANELLYRTFIDSSADMAFLKDDRCRHLLANRALCAFYGKPEEQIIGKTDFELMERKAAQKCEDTDRQALAENRVHVSEETIGDRTFETRKFPVKLADGRSGVGGYIRDISAQIQAESKIYESEARYRLISENSADVIWILDIASQRFTYVSPSVFKLRGLTPQQVMAKPLAAGLTRESYQDIEARLPGRIAALKAGDESAHVRTEEIDQVRRDGSIVHTEAVTTLLADADGRVTEILGVSRDISDRKHAQEALFEMNEIFRLFLEHSPIYVFIKDESIRPVYLSENYEKLLGRPLGEILGKNMDELFPSELSHAMIEDDKRILHEGQTLEFIEEMNGRTYSTIKFPIFIQGRAKYLAGYTMDITERRRSEEMLRVTSRRLELALDSAKAGTWDWDVISGTIEWSPQMFTLLGLDAKTSGASFASWRTALHPEDRELAGKRIELALKLHTNLNSDYRVVLPSGQIRWINALGEGFYNDEGQPIQMIGLCQDITERKQAEEQIRESLLEKEVLLKEIHHRVKNNLQVISGLLTLQAAQMNDERLQKMIKESQSRIWTMALIHQTLYQSGNLADIDMADYIRNLCGNLLSSYAQVAMPPTVSFNLLPLRLVIDKAIPLALIINELLTNALKHAFPEGRPGEIRVSLLKQRSKAGSAPAYELTVADDGGGLPAGFDPQDQKSLGLQLVAMLTKQLGGTLAFASSGGTSVRIGFSDNEKSERHS